jgi:hypothetical protein
MAISPLMFLDKITMACVVCCEQQRKNEKVVDMEF